MTVRVKVCGVTRLEDAQLACELGTSALGFVFWNQSPRYIEPSRAREIVSALPSHVTPVGVFVNPSEADAREVVSTVGLGAVQLHGEESVESFERWPYPVLKAIALRDSGSVETACRLPDGVTVLLDVHDPVKRGGTGQPIDWTLAAEVARRRRVFLAGGLTPSNVADAIEAVRPYGVDVSSGLEVSSGIKSGPAMRAFFEAVKAMGNDGEQPMIKAGGEWP